MTWRVNNYTLGWKVRACDRLKRAALALLLEQRFAVKTIPQITARAGLTTRTFSGTSPTNARFSSPGRRTCLRSWRRSWPRPRVHTELNQRLGSSGGEPMEADEV